MRRFLPALLGISLVFFFVAVLFDKSENASAALVTHIVISEIQIAGINGTDDEFVELYNPTVANIDLAGWRLTRKTSGGTQSTLVSNITGTIPAHGYFLIAHSASYSGTTSPDIMYSAPSQNIASNNSVVLYSDAGATLVDLVGMGTATATETAATSNPASGTSVERKANSSSDSTSMGSGGADEFAGNGEDSDNNSSDFVTRSSSQPQNSSSAIEPVSTPSPTQTPTPTVSPTPSGETSPTLTPTPTPTLTPTPTGPAPKIIAKGPIFTCSINYKPWRFFNKTFFFPFIQCVRTI